MSTEPVEKDRELAELLAEVRALRHEINAIKKIPVISIALGKGPEYAVLVKPTLTPPEEYEVLAKIGPLNPEEYAVAVRPGLDFPPEYAVAVRTILIPMEEGPEVKSGKAGG